MAAKDPALRDHQPWKAACEKDYSWLGDVITKHYQGDDSDVKTLIGGILKAFEGMPVDAYQCLAATFLDRAQHPTLNGASARAATCRWSSCSAISSRTGRRPILAFGDSNGDIEMLQFAGEPGKAALRLLLLHDDKDREFDDTAGAEKSLELARARGWTVVSMKRDWKQVFTTRTPLTPPDGRQPA
jgi:hypothetical protein